MKTLILFLSTFLISQLTFAETCPSLSKLKQHSLAGWKVYDSIEGNIIKGHRAHNFLTYSQKFLLAEWVKKEKNSGEIHCYYGNKDGSNSEAYLAKDKYYPLNPGHSWYSVTNYLHCAAGINNCQFKPVKSS